MGKKKSAFAALVNSLQGDAVASKLQSSEAEHLQEADIAAAAATAEDTASSTTAAAPLGAPSIPRTATAALNVAEDASLQSQNLFRLQLGELLSEVSLKSNKATRTRQALEALKSWFAAQDALEITPEYLHTVVRGQCGLPLHASSLPLYTWKPPSRVEAVGSFELETSIRPFLCVDLAIRIPKSCFPHKKATARDHVYSDCKAAYLAVTAERLSTFEGSDSLPVCDISFSLLNNDPTKPVLVLRPQYPSKPSHHDRFAIRIIPSFGPSTFSLARLLPTKNNVRVSEDPPEAQPDSLPPTPIYNNALLQDVALEFHHAIVQHQLASHRPLVDCLQLLKVWSHKRNLYCVGPSLFISGHAAEAARRPSFGCLNGFLLSMLLVHLLSIGKLTKHMTSYQLLRVVLTYLADAKADLYTKGIIMRPYTGTVADSNAIECASDEELQQSLAIWKLSFEIIFIDPSHRINLAASITRSAAEELQYEAKRSVQLLHENQFEALFTRDQELYYKYDCLVGVTLAPSLVAPKHGGDSELDAKAKSAKQLELQHRRDGHWLFHAYRKLHQVLRRGLGNRAKVVSIARHEHAEWALASEGEEQEAYDSNPVLVLVGVLLDSEHAYRTVDMGPPADDIDKATQFREFWGEKSELRRFKDGSINEAVVWDIAIDDRHRVVRLIIEYLLPFHGITGSLQATPVVLDQLDALISGAGVSFDEKEQRRQRKRQKHHGSEESSNSSSSNAAAAASQAHTPFYFVTVELGNLSKLLMELDNKLVPLQIEGVRGAHAAFCYASPIAPLPHPLLERTGSNASKYKATTSADLYSEPLDVVLQLESSGKWPSDVAAIRWIKCAFYLSISNALHKKYGLTCTATPHYVDIVSGGFTFRARIRLDRELALLSPQSSLPSVGKLSSSSAMFYRSSSGEGLDRESMTRSLVQRPALNTALHAFYLKHLSYGGAVRLAKRWVNAHLFGWYVPEEAIELLVAHVYASSEHFDAPHSHLSGFLRFLHLLATFPWQTAPLIVDLDQSLSPDAIANIQANFETRRAQFPTESAMYIAAPQDRSSTCWTRENPDAAILMRLVAYAQRSVSHIEKLLGFFTHLVHTPKFARVTIPPTAATVSDTNLWRRTLFHTPLHEYDLIIKLHGGVVPNHRLRVDPTCATQYLTVSSGDTVIHESATARVGSKRSLAEASSSSSSSSAAAKSSRRAPNLYELSQYKNLQRPTSVLVGFNPVLNYLRELEARYHDVCLFFFDRYGGDIIAVVWKPSAFVPKPLTVSSSQCAIPVSTSEDSQCLVIPNREQIIGEFEMLGHGIVQDIVAVPKPTHK